MPKYIVAVSGGIDSVVLLDMMSRLPDYDLIVAHFDHGIRGDSDRDAQFVKTLTQKYNVPFETKREELGEDASEDLARRRRYAFLRELAEKHQAPIVTAHHADDVLETIAINHVRGTGWRGLAVLDSDIVRPLLGFTKEDLKNYAQQYDITWREDSTNASDKYLRNRLRGQVAGLEPTKKSHIHALHQRQLELKKDIEAEVRQLVGEGPKYSRYFFTHIPANVAIECLRYVTQGALTRPQLTRALLAIKTVHPGKIFEASKQVKLHFHARSFTVEMVK
ncbi:MAG TPA: tRNA lysidine(34) synthetase TilS [Candidatus Saccharibacteria bacterium]|nr:tRNA lysidine(34) synthetase TilS [Candidatus Saccharibacteria bacterium]